MASQKQIATLLGVTQSTVSRALRGDRRISEDIRQRVQETAQKEGYHPNAYVNALMERVRSGQKPDDRGVIGLLVEARSQKDWYEIEAYKVFHQGTLQAAAKLGFHLETFFLHEPGLSSARIDQILQARGIAGLIIAPPYRGNRTLHLSWDRYAAVGVGFGWEEQELNRVVHDSLQNYVTAFRMLRNAGYRRIGTVLGKTLAQGTRHGVKWYTGYLECQDSIPAKERVPVLISDNPPPGAVLSDRIEKPLMARFCTWMLKWKPDAVITMIGREKKWLETIPMKIPEDIGMACLAKPMGTNYAGIEEAGDMIGATAVELIASQIYRNEFGLPARPKTTMIEGRWSDGVTLKIK